MVLEKRGGGFEKERRGEKRRCGWLICVWKYLVGWGNTPTEASFGGGGNDGASVKGKLVNLISSVRTLMRSEFACSFFDLLRKGGCGLLWGFFVLGKGGFFG